MIAYFPHFLWQWSSHKRRRNNLYFLKISCSFHCNNQGHFTTNYGLNSTPVKVAASLLATMDLGPFIAVLHLALMLMPPLGVCRFQRDFTSMWKKNPKGSLPQKQVTWGTIMGWISCSRMERRKNKEGPCLVHLHRGLTRPLHSAL